jgi:hypothetical protein
MKIGTIADFDGIRGFAMQLIGFDEEIKRNKQPKCQLSQHVHRPCKSWSMSSRFIDRPIIKQAKSLVEYRFPSLDIPHRTPSTWQSKSSTPFSFNDVSKDKMKSSSSLHTDDLCQSSTSKRSIPLHPTIHPSVCFTKKTSIDRSNPVLHWHVIGRSQTNALFYNPNKLSQTESDDELDNPPNSVVNFS